MSTTHERRVPRVCPHCAQPLQPVRYGVAFGPIAVRILDTIARAGSAGVSADDLFGAVYGRSNGATIHRLRSYISQINVLIAGSGVAIRGDRNVYRIVTRHVRQRA